ncbi:response regulator transcription factor [Enterobacter ludwigii]|uniref:response regulator transcription factor n=1 Tax=Enterobacter ludwigii TaxID=299767 RepID=UPI00079AC7B3|nr:LuxR C-terminal-related transcriptional regulator [Enterobacter ludwigii]MDR6398768.1 FixJ family two-component response regulator [Enterobacter ludwigii]WPL54935.1 LuxR C-terminal-related transcriptional regulator [Enterobacter ludwigii]WRM06635.1 LuxR C-terminal-related transcriptional regulator [Enterobacter ludwigii]CZU28033.1 transcriptional regulator fixJ [Enterobacter ludwigii]HDT3267106.1 response regulator transcription factor [Enterobacter ludwigii]
MDNTVWLIDDDESIRESLAFLLSGMGWQVNGFESVDAFTSAHGGCAALVGCLLLDMRMPGKGGLTWLEEGNWPWPLLPVIVMTGHGTVDACRRAFRNGVFEFFTKPLDADKLIETVGLAFEESQRRLTRWQETSRIKARFEQLTAREHEVLAVLMEGCSNKEVALQLNLSPRTVEAHRAAAFAKLGVTSLVQAIRDYDKLQSV